ncbi:MAG TPA: hypothetical protein VF215_03985 [Thermoanaerobaculia bacterium]
MLAIAEVGHARVRERERQQRHVEHDWSIAVLPVVEHLGSALIVAAVMGLSYEYVVHRHVVRDFERLLQHHEDTTDERLAALEAITAHEVFSFVGKVAVRLERIPTLYEPARSETNEIVFATDREFFRSLIGSRKARADTVRLLDGWLDSAKLNLRFLASDFAGMLRLDALEPRLRDLASEWEKGWERLKDDEKGCVLNFWWAASRCETPMYETLLRRLILAPDRFTRQWILFVPRQMPDERWAQILDTYLRYHQQNDTVDQIEADHLIEALRKLHTANIRVKPIVVRNRAIFQKLQCWDAACRAIEHTTAAKLHPSDALAQAAKRFRWWRRKPDV